MNEKVLPFIPPIGFDEAGKRADSILKRMTIDEKIDLIGGHKLFFIKGFSKYGIPQFYLSDATQGVHIRKELSNLMEKSTAFPCPLALTATWNTNLAVQYAKCIGEECRVSDVAVLLGPGMNIYRISQNGRNFEYFGEDPFLAARMVENYLVGMQSTGVMATLKHFCCNNTDHHRRQTNSIVDERTLNEIYLPAFKAGIDAGAMAVMTSYNKVNGEYAGQSDFVINKLLREHLGFKWLVMSDWWSVYDPEKVIKSGLDLEMPGHAFDQMPALKELGDIYVRSNAKRLLEEGKVSEADIDRMALSIMRTFIAMGLYDEPVKDLKYIENFPRHEEVALQTAREAIVLLRNEKNILPIDPAKIQTILLTGVFVEEIARGGGSAEVEGYNLISILDALKAEFGANIEYIKEPTKDQVQSAHIVLISVGTLDAEESDRPFELPDIQEKKILDFAALNPNVIVIVNSGGGVKMSDWNTKVAGIIYAWYIGQNGNRALAEIISGKVNPSGKLPITIEMKFEDSPGYPYYMPGDSLDSIWKGDMNWKTPQNDIVYKEGVFVGYRWYDSKEIEPLYHFGFGLSYTSFEIGELSILRNNLNKGGKVTIGFSIKNTGLVEGAEVVQAYVTDEVATVARPVKELKAFRKVFLAPGQEVTIEIELCKIDFSFWDVATGAWLAEPGKFKILVGFSSADIKTEIGVTLETV
jgi:beta-glucosidase